MDSIGLTAFHIPAPAENSYKASAFEAGSRCHARLLFSKRQRLQVEVRDIPG
jgi:hypothetical protein